MALPLREGDKVTFFSHQHGCFLPSSVARVGPVGEVELGANPGVWIGVSQQRSDILGDGSEVILHSKTGPLQARIVKANRSDGSVDVEWKTQMSLPAELQRASLARLPPGPGADAAGYPAGHPESNYMLSKPSLPLPPQQNGFVPLNTVKLETVNIDGSAPCGVAGGAAGGGVAAAPVAVGEPVQFWSNTLRTWMPADVVSVNNGFVELNVKRGHLLSPAEQRQRMRRCVTPQLITRNNETAEKAGHVRKAKDDLRRVFRVFDRNGGLDPGQYAEFQQLFLPLFRGLPHQGAFAAVDRDRNGRISLDELWAFLWPLLNTQPQMFSQFIKAEPVRKQLDKRHAMIWTRPETPEGEWPQRGPEACPEAVATLEEAMSHFCKLTRTGNILRMFEHVERFHRFADAQDPVAWLESLLKATSKPLLLCNKIRRPEYAGKPLGGKRAVVVGAGPSGLRTAIELQLCGAQVHVFDKRENFDRANILKMWDFMAYDLMQLGARELLPRFVVYKDHIGIRELQALLLKVCLLLHVPIHLGEAGHVSGLRWNEAAPHTIETMDGREWLCDLIFAADSTDSYIGKSIGLPHLPPIAAQKTRLAVVVNFVNAGQEHDWAVNEHCERIRNHEVSDHVWGDITKKLKTLGVNQFFVYLQGETHYFISSPEVEELRQQDFFRNPRLPVVPGSREEDGLIDAANVDQAKLERWFRRVAASYTENDTGLSRAHVDAFWSKRPIERDETGKPAMGLFTFRSPASRAVAAMKFVAGCPVFLVGDALEEPYWPKGEGMCKGFLSVLDAVHTACLWAAGAGSEADLEDWRQALYRQSSTIPKSLRNPVLRPEEGAVPGFTSANYKYTLDPRTRYLDYKEL